MYIHIQNLVTGEYFPCHEHDVMRIVARNGIQYFRRLGTEQYFSEKFELYVLLPASISKSALLRQEMADRANRVRSSLCIE